jgi:hypothetical protein
MERASRIMKRLRVAMDGARGGLLLNKYKNISVKLFIGRIGCFVDFVFYPC